MELRIWINGPESGVANAACEVMLLMWEKFKTNRKEIPYHHYGLRMRSNVTMNTVGNPVDLGENNPIDEGNSGTG